MSDTISIHTTEIVPAKADTIPVTQTKKRRRNRALKQTETPTQGFVPCFVKKYSTGTVSNQSGKRLSKDCKRHFQHHCWKCGFRGHTQKNCPKYPGEIELVLCSRCEQGIHPSSLCVSKRKDLLRRNKSTNVSPTIDSNIETPESVNVVVPEAVSNVETVDSPTVKDEEYHRADCFLRGICFCANIKGYVEVFTEAQFLQRLGENEASRASQPPLPSTTSFGIGVETAKIECEKASKESPSYVDIAFLLLVFVMAANYLVSFLYML